VQKNFATKEILNNNNVEFKDMNLITFIEKTFSNKKFLQHIETYLILMTRIYQLS